MKRAVLAISLALCCATLVQAAQNSPQRVRDFARLPNWTGLWEWDNWKADFESGEPAALAELVRSARLADHPPYNPQWEARYAADSTPEKMAAYGQRRKSCHWRFPQQMESPRMLQYFITPEETLILSDGLDARHVYTDGRTHPGKDDLWPTPSGDSVGHWDKDTLVIDTIARAAGPIGQWAPASVLTEKAHFIERIRLLGADAMEDQMTIEDAEAFARPWQLTIRYHRVKGLDRMIVYDCAENDRNPVIDGQLKIVTP
ncbi:MAG TPA: hypothetical protein VLW26_00970 [Steroidobacteraceae bacterium]|nr:hypothetical protein [Steroidobacteraceae bacterium]